MTYAQLPPWGEARFIIPREASRDAATGLHFFGASPARRATSRLLRAGAGRVLPGSQVADHLSAVVEAALVDARLSGSVVVHLGPPRRNRKPVAVVIRDGAPAAVLKVGVDALTSQLVRNEAATLTRMATDPMPQILAPRVMGAGTVGDSAYLVQSVLDRSTARPATTAEVRAVTPLLVSSVPTWSGPLGESDWARRLVTQLNAAPDSEDTSTAYEQFATLKGEHGEQILTCGAFHGDLSPWNSAFHADSLLLWDWERAEDSIPAGFDIMHFSLFDHVRAGRDFATSAKMVLADANQLLDVPGIAVESRQPTAIAYFIMIAARFSMENQRSTGSPGGDVARWLPALLREHRRVAS